MKEFYRGSHVRVFRLDRERVLEHLRHCAVRLLAERSDVVRVWLFGSLARGDASPGSDADLMIVVRDGAGAFLERARTLMPFFDGVGVGCDVLVYTEAEVEQLARTPSLVRTALAGGILLAGEQTQEAGHPVTLTFSSVLGEKPAQSLTESEPQLYVGWTSVLGSRGTAAGA